MKTFYSPIVFIVLISFVFIGCPHEVKPPYEFKEQDLQGEIENVSWVYLSGVARSSLSSNDTLSIGIYNIELDKPCSYAVSEAGVLFNIPKKEGLFVLNADWNNFQAITLYNGIDKKYALGGAIEIIKIDSVASFIEGRIDARVDNNSYINGNFLIPLCD